MQGRAKRKDRHNVTKLQVTSHHPLPFIVKKQFIPKLKGGLTYTYSKPFRRVFVKTFTSARRTEAAASMVTILSVTMSGLESGGCHCSLWTGSGWCQPGPVSRPGPLCTLHSVPASLSPPAPATHDHISLSELHLCLVSNLHFWGPTILRPMIS